jgi:hypothetical protein
MSVAFAERRILVWCKTYPELSSRHRETVCTAGCTEDGTPIRLYPVDLRYLTKTQQYRLYQWITVPAARNPKDPRPESYKIRADQMRLHDVVGTAHNWADRRRILFADTSWHYDCLEDLKERQKRTHHSLGLVRVGAVDEVTIEQRSDADRQGHERKLRQLASVGDLFGGTQKRLDFIPFRVRVRWRCAPSGRRVCPGHSASVLDWGLLELGRREGALKAHAKMVELCDLRRYDLRFFVGNFFTHPQVFGVIGMWYPRQPSNSPPQADLFDP